MDKDTKQIIAIGKILKEFISHEGYSIMKKALLNKVSELIDLHNLDLNLTPEQLAIEVKANKKASQIILDVIRLEIEGTAHQAESNTQGLTLNDNSYIVREDLTD